jgi:hypothetical protein
MVATFKSISLKINGYLISLLLKQDNPHHSILLKYMPCNLNIELYGIINSTGLWIFSLFCLLTWGICSCLKINYSKS